MSGVLTEARKRFHTALTKNYTLSVSKDGVASNADGGQTTSIVIAQMIAEHLEAALALTDEIN
jgi:hypothetical protein